jgi:predicted transcriptional regulator
VETENSKKILSILRRVNIEKNIVHVIGFMATLDRIVIYEIFFHLKHVLQFLK